MSSAYLDSDDAYEAKLFNVIVELLTKFTFCTRVIN